MREIKFRAWDSEFQVMYFSEGKPYGVFYFHGEWKIQRRFDNGLGDKAGDVSIDGEKYILMQYTGLKDKNGKEIYEGDIIDFSVFNHEGEDDPYKGIVKFSEGQWQLWNSNENEFYCGDGAFGLFWVYQQDCEIEVIGNIHENPELLK